MRCVCFLSIDLLSTDPIPSHNKVFPAPPPVLGQSFDGQSCEQVPVGDLKNVTVGDAPNIASFAEAAALRGAAQWYKPTDHEGCERLPLIDFMSSVNVISACYFDDSGRPNGMSSFNGTSATYVVNWNGTVPCSPENAEKLKEKTGNPDLPFTLEFETSFIIPGDVSEVPIVETKFVGGYCCWTRRGGVDGELGSDRVDWVAALPPRYPRSPTPPPF